MFSHSPRAIQWLHRCLLLVPSHVFPSVDTTLRPNDAAMITSPMWGAVVQAQEVGKAEFVYVKQTGTSITR